MVPENTYNAVKNLIMESSQIAVATRNSRNDEEVKATAHCTGQRYSYKTLRLATLHAREAMDPRDIYPLNVVYSTLRQERGSSFECKGEVGHFEGAKDKQQKQCAVQQANAEDAEMPFMTII